MLLSWLKRFEAILSHVRPPPKLEKKTKKNPQAKQKKKKKMLAIAPFNFGKFSENLPKKKKKKN